MYPHKVIITRPIAQARDFAEKVRRIGAEAILFPLIDIRALEDQREIAKEADALDQFSLVVFVSPNAIDAFMPHVTNWPPSLTIAVMGSGSRHALVRYGLTEQNTRIVSPANTLKTDSETLLEVLDTDALAGKKVLIVRGNGGREFLSDALRSAGAEVQLLSSYERMTPDFDGRKQAELMQLLSVDNRWVITSSEALRTLVDWVKQLQSGEFVAKLQHQEIIVPHVRIAETAQRLGFHFITLTASGDESVLVALQSLV
ncbi:uroporphyrinogen-III synthase [Undibacterium sp. RuRC25W]|uniref:uroporphyrinogen-III synthase n=1 Tax=Undibacterium sp. RuRC25W TaxID=3413047 RepID=UPI003BF1AA54